MHHIPAASDAWLFPDVPARARIVHARGRVDLEQTQGKTVYAGNSSHGVVAAAPAVSALATYAKLSPQGGHKVRVLAAGACIRGRGSAAGGVELSPGQQYTISTLLGLAGVAAYPGPMTLTVSTDQDGMQLVPNGVTPALSVGAYRPFTVDLALDPTVTKLRNSAAVNAMVYLMAQRIGTKFAACFNVDLVRVSIDGATGAVLDVVSALPGLVPSTVESLDGSAPAPSYVTADGRGGPMIDQGEGLTFRATTNVDDFISLGGPSLDAHLMLAVWSSDDGA